MTKQTIVEDRPLWKQAYELAQKHPVLVGVGSGAIALACAASAESFAELGEVELSEAVKTSAKEDDLMQDIQQMVAGATPATEVKTPAGDFDRLTRALFARGFTAGVKWVAGNG